MRKTFKLLELEFQDALDSRARSFVWFLLSVINPLSLLLFWQGASKTMTGVSGWNTATITSYYLLLMLAGTLLHVHIEEDIAEYDIREGRLSTYLLRPYSYFWFKFFRELPYRLLQTGFAIVMYLVVAVISPNIFLLTQSITDFLFLGVMLILAFFISFLFKMIIGIMTFWFTDYHGLQETAFVLVLLLAGFVMPLELYPDLLAQAARFTPFPYIIYYPVLLVQGKLALLEIIRILLFQSMWIAVLVIVYRWLWVKGLKKYTAIGI